MIAWSVAASWSSTQPSLRSLEPVDVERHDHVARLALGADVDVRLGHRLDVLNRQLPARGAGIGVQRDLGRARAVRVRRRIAGEVGGEDRLGGQGRAGERKHCQQAECRGKRQGEA